MRWVLVRRGLLLYAFGALLEWVWNGTILFFYGAYFMLAALLFTLRARWLVTIAAAAAVSGHAIAWWAEDHQATWLPVSYTHPTPPTTSPASARCLHSSCDMKK